MKIIHCADVHLGSSLSANFDAYKAKERGAELFTTFSTMFEYASKNGIGAIIIAGDLFDKDKGIKNLKNSVASLIEKYPDIAVYYLKGNHDGESEFERMPENLYTFSESDWTSYELAGSDRIKITGIELSKSNKGYIYNTLALDSGDYNIVVMHGQESNNDGKKDAEIVNLKSLKGKDIDYLALGHIHAHKEAELDKRGVYCYSGCLEGRGFDESGEHGFVLLDIDEKNHDCKRTFVPFARRTIYHDEIDITEATDTMKAIEIVGEYIAEHACREGSIAEFILTGDLDLDVNIDESLVQSHFKDDFYVLKVRSDLSIKIDYSSFEKDESLKGEFVRSVMSDAELAEDEKGKIIKYGLDALMGKELA